jgi:hypothetical protein
MIVFAVRVEQPPEGGPKFQDRVLVGHGVINAAIDLRREATKPKPARPISIIDHVGGKGVTEMLGRFDHAGAH